MMRIVLSNVTISIHVNIPLSHPHIKGKPVHIYECNTLTPQIKGILYATNVMWHT